MSFCSRVGGVFLAVWLSCFLCLPVVGRTQECQTGKDWKDIYVLPSNPNPTNNIKITLQTDKARAQPGQQITVTFQADRDCYLTLMDMGTSGRIIRLWPNQYSGSDNFVRANVSRSFPGPGDPFLFQIGGPDGTERIIAYATSEKGKILTEEEFRSLQNSGFKEFLGGALDLANQFEKGLTSIAPGSSWGTAQVNVCIGSGSPGPPPSASGPSNYYVLALGGKYHNLKYTMKDARSFVDSMKARMGIPESNVRLVLGMDVTYENFVGGLNWLASRTQPQDTAVIYFSGHGTQIPDQPPLDEEDGRDEAFVFSTIGSRSVDWRTALREKLIMVDDEFNVLVKKIPARKKIVVVDACHSGTIDKAMDADDDNFVIKYFPLLDPDTGKELPPVMIKSAAPNYGNDNEALLAACLDNENSIESPGLRGGVFTHYLLKFVNQGAPDLEKAFEKAKEATIKYVRENRKPGDRVKSQTPSLTDPHGLTRQVKFSR